LLWASRLFLSVLAFDEKEHALDIKNQTCNLNLHYLVENYFYLKSTCSKVFLPLEMNIVKIDF
jgi:hypothetical protein